MTIAVLDYGSGNLRSVAHALERVGADVEVTGDGAAVRRASGLVVPGVGHFGACMTSIRERRLDATIDDFIATGRPVFGVCVGMQVLFEGSEEAAGVRGLGVFEGTVKRLPEVVTTPHMGWNEVSWVSEPLHPYGADTPSPWCYFAHSFAAEAAGPETVAVSTHGVPFAAAAARDNVFATQFHPEKSGDAGLALYRAFAKDAAS